MGKSYFKKLHAIFSAYDFEHELEKHLRLQSENDYDGLKVTVSLDEKSLKKELAKICAEAADHLLSNDTEVLLEPSGVYIRMWDLGTDRKCIIPFSWETILCVDEPDETRVTYLGGTDTYLNMADKLEYLAKRCREVGKDADEKLDGKPSSVTPSQATCRPYSSRD